LTYAAQLYTEIALLRFHGRNGYTNAPQCYFIHTLCILFVWIVFQGVWLCRNLNNSGYRVCTAFFIY